jgi:hypothetical protein
MFSWFCFNVSTCGIYLAFDDFGLHSGRSMVLLRSLLLLYSSRFNLYLERFIFVEEFTDVARLILLSSVPPITHSSNSCKSIRCFLSNDIFSFLCCCVDCLSLLMSSVSLLPKVFINSTFQHFLASSNSMRLLY